MEEEAERLQEPEYQDVYFETVSHKNDCMNKIWTMLVSVDTVMLKGLSLGITPLDQGPKALMTAEREGESASLIPNWLFNIKCLALKLYTHRQEQQQYQNQPDSAGCIHIFVHIYDWGLCWGANPLNFSEIRRATISGKNWLKDLRVNKLIHIIFIICHLFFLCSLQCSLDVFLSVFLAVPCCSFLMFLLHCSSKSHSFQFIYAHRHS